jgi:hypothetical protein
MKECSSVADTNKDALLLGEITVSLTDICSFQSGASLALVLPEIIEAMRIDQSEPIVSMRTQAGVFKLIPSESGNFCKNNSI